MCLFITAALPPGAHAALPPALLRQYELAFTPLDNPHALEQLPPGWTWHHATGAHCDCDSALGTVAEAPDGEPLEKDVARFRRRGWSEERIRRWREERLADQQRRTATVERRGLEAADWASFLRAALEVSGVPALGVLLHWHSGMLTTERVLLETPVRVPAEEITRENLLRLERDVLYLFQRPQPAK